MKAKDMIIEFINVIFGVAIISTSIIYFITGDNFDNFGNFMKSLAPIAIFALLMMILNSFRKMELKKRERECNLKITLELTYYDKLISDFTVFLIPMAILVVPLFMLGKIDKIDLIQSLIAFIVMGLWQKYLFNKEDL
ncbi:hypothetical protein K8R62_04225 [bacterium]|nr:hypothetical protein [bacterium]